MTNPRTAHMLGPDGARGTGLEIGALHAPTLLKSEHDLHLVTCLWQKQNRPPRAESEKHPAPTTT